MRTDPGTALALLAGVLAVGLAGIMVYVTGAAQRQSLADRSTLAGPEPLGSRLAFVLGGRLRRTRLGRWLTVLLASAGVEMTPLTFLGLCLVALLAGYALTALLFAFSLALFFGLCCVGACFAWVERQRTRRRFEFVAQLPEMARLLSNGAQAGLSLAGAVERAARELDEPAAGELAAVVAELRLGRSLEDSLHRLRGRLPSREVAVLMSTLIIQQRAGGDTVRALQDMAETLEARKDTLREVRTLMSGAVFTSYIVAAMGIGTIFLMNIMSPGVLDKMISSLAGLGALAFAAVLYAVAFVLIRTTTRIDV